MFHRIHIGFFDLEELRSRKPVVTQLLPMDLIRPILDRYVLDSDDGKKTISGEPVEISQEFIICPWISLGVNVNAVRLAIEINERLPGCVFVDFGSGELISKYELLESISAIE